MLRIITNIGKYFILLSHIFGKPEKVKVYRKQIVYEMMNLGTSSLGIVVIISIFMGAVITLQTSAMIDSPLIPLYTVGYTTRQSMILEFAPTVISFVLAGKIGSNIASEIGTMRITEQIDAMDIMGINSAAYLVLPKIIAAVVIFPFLIIFSMFLGVLGGWLVVKLTAVVTSYSYYYGITYGFRPFTVVYALIKTVVFAFVITSVSSFWGYYTKGGALDVGKSSTKAVVNSIIVILIMNLVLTQLLLI